MALYELAENCDYDRLIFYDQIVVGIQVVGIQVVGIQVVGIQDNTFSEQLQLTKIYIVSNLEKFI